MNIENLQHEPNYVFSYRHKTYYRIIPSDGSAFHSRGFSGAVDKEYRFYAPDDYSARELVSSFIDKHTRNIKEKDGHGGKFFEDTCIPWGLERIVKRMEIVERRIPVSLPILD
ncbi:hypothetical protein KY362_01995 [Candidatus Woesearchaeota archaeon]|nr:hypothetical protein [Candidatus Woesearchaeota archaeon]